MSDDQFDYLSPAWLAAMRRAAEATQPSVDPVLVIQQVVETGSDGPEGAGPVAWWVAFWAGGVRLAEGRHRAPDITLTQDRRTAAAVASGRQSAQAAFLAGQLRVGGDVQLLLDHQDELAELEDVFAEVRAATAYPDLDRDPDQVLDPDPDLDPPAERS